jgi:hypothetical protein
METDLIAINERLESIKMTHPNLYKLWKNYINIKIKRHNAFLLECDVFLDKIHIQSDLEIQDITALLVLKNVL